MSRPRNIRFSIVLAAFACAPAGAETPLLFGNPEFRIGRGARFVAMEDLDGDGDLDLVASNSNDDTVSVLLNTGSGDYAPQAVYAVDDEPNGLAVADLDGDLDADIAVANRAAGTMVVLLNAGDGTFAYDGSYGAGIDPVAVVLGDLDGDGDRDAVVVDRAGDAALVLLNSGDATFTAGDSYEVTNSPTAAALGDINADGLLDLLVVASNENDPSGGTGLLHVLYNGGSGENPSWLGFTSSDALITDPNPSHVVVAEIDGAAPVDVAVVNSGPIPSPPESTVSIFLNDVEGGLMPAVYYAVPEYPIAMAVADLDGDGDRDFAVSHWQATTFTDTNLSVLVNAGDGTFGGCTTYGVSDMPAMVASGDVDGDGDDDLAAACFADPVVSVLLNSGGGTFSPDARYPAGAHPVGLDHGDLDGDGTADVVTASGNGAEIAVHLNSGDGTLQPQVLYPVADAPTAVALADLDGDEDVDIAAANTDDFVSVLMNLGDGTFAAPATHAVGFKPKCLALGDLDGDQDTDMAVGFYTVDYADTRVAILLNDGAGVFSAGGELATDGVIAIAIDDLDGDGDLDVATCSSSDVSVHLNDGDATFAPRVDYPAGTSAFSLALGDVDGDQDVDILTNESSNGAAGGGNLLVLANGGDGTFAPAVAWPAGDRAFAATLGDVDGDGDLDIAAAINHSNQYNYYAASVALNEGDGTFGPPILYDAGISPSSLAVADLDGNGANDLLVTNASGNDLSVLLNQSTPAAPCPGDVDGDGEVGITDFLALLAAWGPNPGHPSDLDGDGEVGITDFLALLGAWGPC